MRRHASPNSYPALTLNAGHLLALRYLTNRANSRKSAKPSLNANRSPPPVAMIRANRHLIADD